MAIIVFIVTILVVGKIFDIFGVPALNQRNWPRLGITLAVSTTIFFAGMFLASKV